MQLLIKFIGVFVILQGFAFLLRPDLLRGLLKFFSSGNRIYIIAAARIVLAVLLFIGATQCHLQWIIIAIAIITLLSGITIFTLKPATFKKLLTWYQQRSDIFLRLIAIVVLIVGALIVYAA